MTPVHFRLVNHAGPSHILCRHRPAAAGEDHETQLDYVTCRVCRMESIGDCLRFYRSLVQAGGR